MFLFRLLQKATQSKKLLTSAQIEVLVILSTANRICGHSVTTLEVKRELEANNNKSRLGFLLSHFYIIDNIIAFNREKKTLGGAKGY